MNLRDVTNKVTQTVGDKIAHVGCGGVLGLALSGHAVLALFAVTGLAIGKEIYDHYNPTEHTADIADALYTVGGGVVGILIGQLIMWIL